MFGKLLALALICFLLLGCSDQTVTVGGDHAQKGLVVRDIQQSRDVANQASDQMRDGDKAVDGQ